SPLLERRISNRRKHIVRKITTLCGSYLPCKPPGVRSVISVRVSFGLQCDPLRPILEFFSGLRLNSCRSLLYFVLQFFKPLQIVKETTHSRLVQTCKRTFSDQSNHNSQLSKPYFVL